MGATGAGVSAAAGTGTAAVQAGRDMSSTKAVKPKLYWEQHGTKISMDSRGRALDNTFTERLWRSVKYEEVYLKEYVTVMEAKESIGRYFQFYNYERKHQAHGYKTPAEIYFERRKKVV